MSSNGHAFGRRVGELLDRIGRVTREAQFSDGLNPAQWETLRFLARANRLSRSPGAVADYLGCTKGTISQTLISLEQKGFVARLRDDADRRAVRLELTEAGRTAIERDPIIALERAAATLDAEVHAPLVQGLSRLLYDLQATRGIRQFGVCHDCVLHCCDGHEAHPPGANHCGATGGVIEPGDEESICGNFRPLAAE
jgi:DNA-binding MarR family transcriptional regulator